MCAKNYENWLAVDKVIVKITRLTFLANPVYCDICGRGCASRIGLFAHRRSHVWS